MNQEFEAYREELIIDGPPWEKRDVAGFFKTLLLTISAMIRNPVQVFAVMRRTGEMNSALQYSVLLQVLGTVFSLAISTIVTGRSEIIPAWMVDVLGSEYDWGTIFIVSLPFMAILEQYFKPLFLNLALGMVGQTNATYSTVFRITAYSNGTAAVWMLIPGIGGLIYIGYNFFLMLAGFRTIYAMRNGQFLGAILLAAFLGFLSLMAFSLVITLLFAGTAPA